MKTKRQPVQQLFAFRVQDDGSVDYIGQVLAEQDNNLRVEVIDAVMGCCGIWSLSGEIRDLNKSQCRMFTNESDCLGAALRINQQFFKATR